MGDGVGNRDGRQISPRSITKLKIFELQKFGAPSSLMARACRTLHKVFRSVSWLALLSKKSKVRLSSNFPTRTSEKCTGTFASGYELLVFSCLNKTSHSGHAAWPSLRFNRMGAQKRCYLRYLSWGVNIHRAPIIASRHDILSLKLGYLYVVVIPHVTSLEIINHHRPPRRSLLPLLQCLRLSPRHYRPLPRRQHPHSPLHYPARPRHSPKHPLPPPPHP